MKFSLFISSLMPRVNGVKAYCRAPNRRATHIIKDKYEKGLYRYWVEEGYTGTFTREEAEESEEETVGGGEGLVGRGVASLAALRSAWLWTPLPQSWKTRVRGGHLHLGLGSGPNPKSIQTSRIGIDVRVNFSLAKQIS